MQQGFFHGTKADLGIGDLLVANYGSNFGSGTPLSWIYFAGTLEAAVWGAELAAGDGHERIYVVQATGPFEDDPNLTDKKFPGNPTRSYRSRDPLEIVGEVVGWRGHPVEQVQAMREGVARLLAEGAEIID